MVKMSLALDPFKAISDWVFNAIGVWLYNTIGHIIISLLDWLQSIFRGLAGLEGMKINGQAVNGEGQESYDIAYWLISTDIIMDIFWSMVLFSVFLLIIMTILAIIRNTYEEKQKPVWDIIMASFKGLVGFIIVPAFAVVGLMFSNVILKAVDAGTSFGNSTKMSTNLFMSSAYDANLLRQDDIDDCRKEFKNIVNKTNFEDYEDVGTYYAEIDTLTLDDFELLATKLDNAFTAEKIKTNLGVTLTAQRSMSVSICYSLFNINYIILLAGGCTLIGVFFKMCWGMVSRIFKLCFDFVLIPVVHAMMPFDNGNAIKSWKGDFVKNVTMAYGTVGAINLYFSILPIVNNIEFNNGGIQSWGLFASIFRLMISIVGVFSANGIIKTVNGWFGVGDVLSEGESAFKTFQGGLKSIKGGFGVKDKIKKGTKAAMNMHGAYLGGRQAAGKAGGNKFWGGIQGAFGQTSWGKNMSEMNWAKNVNEAKKKGGEAYNDARLYGFGLNKDLLSANTDAFDSRKAKLDLQKNLANFDKRTAGMEDKPKLKELYEMEDMKAILSNGGYNIDGMSSTEYLNKTAGMESKNNKNREGQQKLDAFVSAKENQRVAFHSARSLGVSEDDIRKFLAGDTSILNKKSQEQIDALKDIVSAKVVAEEQVKEAAIYLSKTRGLAGSLSGKKEEDLRKMDSADLAEKMASAYKMKMDSNNSTNDLSRVAGILEAEISQAEVDIKERKDKQEASVAEIKELMDKYYRGDITKKNDKNYDADIKKIKQILEARSKMK